MGKLFFLLTFFFMTSVTALCQSQKELKSDMEEARETKRDIFIEMNNGKFILFEKLKIKAAVLGYDHFDGDGKKLDIPFDSVRSYQTEDYYAVRVDSTPKVHLGKMPARELFAMRLRTGKIELFYSYRQKDNALGIATADKHMSYFIRKGKNGKLVELSKAALKLMIADNKALAEEFDDIYKKRNEYDSATKVLDEYN